MEKEGDLQPTTVQISKIRVKFLKKIINLEVPRNFTQSDILETIEKKCLKVSLKDFQLSISRSKYKRFDYYIKIYKNESYFCCHYTKYFSDLEEYIADKNNYKILHLLKIAPSNAADIEDNNLLHYIVQTDNTTIAASLIAAGCNINLTNVHGQTPLHKAVSYGIKNKFIHMIKLLIESNVDVNIKTNNGTSPLHLAILTDNDENDVISNLDVIQLLFEAGADINANDSDGDTPLHTVKSIEIARLLLKVGANVHIKNEKGNLPLHKSIERKNWPITKCLIEAGTDLNALNNEGNTFLHIAAAAGCLITLEFFLKKNFQLDITNKDDLDVLSYHLKQQNTFNRFIKRVEKFFTLTPTIIETFCEKMVKEQLKCIEMLLDYGAYINKENKYQESPLSLCLGSPIEIVHYLLKRGADVDLENDRIFNFINSSTDTESTTGAEISEDKEISDLLLKYYSISKVHEGFYDIFSEFLTKDREDYAAFCENELKYMKTVHLCEKVTVFNLLVDRNITSYARNEKIEKKFKTLCTRKTFPIYFHLLEERFVEALEMVKTVKKAIIKLSYIFQTGPSLLVYDRIVQYLNKNDLVNLSLI